MCTKIPFGIDGSCESSRMSDLKNIFVPANVRSQRLYMDQYGKPTREADVPTPHEASFFFASWLQKKKKQNRLEPQ